MTDYGPAEVTETEAALLMAEAWITQRPMTSDYLSWIMPVARELRRKCEERARAKFRPVYHWLGAAGEGDAS
jgi:hypothetical protein